MTAPTEHQYLETKRVAMIAAPMLRQLARRVPRHRCMGGAVSYAISAMGVV
jgi:hypothetical protein